MEPVMYLNKKFIFFVVMILCLQTARSQVYQLMPQYGYDAKRMKFDSTLQIPTFCGVPRLASAITRNGAIAFDSCNGRFYFYNPTNQTWDTIRGGSASTPTLQQVTTAGNTTTTNIQITDDLRIRNSINGKIGRIIAQGEINSNRSYYLPDTTGRIVISVNGNTADSKGNISVSGTDTTSLSNRINAKADTSAVNLKLNISDTVNKWVNNVVSISDSTFRVIKGSTNTDITIRSVNTSVSTTKLITNVWNNSGAVIPRGAVVYINGAHSSNLPTIALARANQESTSAYTYGLVQDSISNNSAGIVIQNGLISNLNLPTSTYTDGQTLYLSPFVSGGYTLTKPLAPYHYVAIGTITRAHPVFGQIQIAIRNGFQLDEMSDVSISALPNDSTLLQFSRADSLWHDVSPLTAIGNRYLKPSDTASLSSRINLRLLISDTATMLSPYLRKRDTASLSSRIDAKIGGSGTNGSISKFTASGTIGNATVDVDYLQQDMSLVAMQSMGSSIKGYNIGAPIPTALATAFTMTSQQLFVIAVYIPKSVTLTGVRWFQVVNGSFTANNYNGVALYTQSGGTLTLVDSSIRDGNCWQQGTNWRNKDFVTPYSASAGIYYIGILYSSSAQTTAPQIGTSGSTSGTYNANTLFDFTNNNRAGGTLASQTTLPTTQALSGTSTNGNRIGVYLY